MGIRASHCINGFDFLPFGSITKSNTEKYLSWFLELNYIQQLYWCIAVTEYESKSCLYELGRNNSFRKIFDEAHNSIQPKSINIAGFILSVTLPLALVKDRLISKWVVFPVEDDALELAKWLVKRDAGIELDVKNAYINKNNDVSNAFLYEHILCQGYTTGFYEDHNGSKNTLESTFTAISPRTAFLDNCNI